MGIETKEGIFGFSPHAFITLCKLEEYSCFKLFLKHKIMKRLNVH